MSGIIYYNSYDIFVNPENSKKLEQIPGGNEFSCYFKIFSRNISAFDRTGVMKIPLKLELLSHMRMPKFRQFNTSFEEICDNRSLQLIQQSLTTNRKIAIMYSGGIDSTLIVCAFLKNATEEFIKNNIIILLSQHSIEENPNFYYNFIIKKFTCVNSYRFTHFLGNDNFLMVTGDNVDQLFGSQVNDEFASYSSQDDLFEPMDKMTNKVIDWMSTRFDKNDKNQKLIEGSINIYKKIVDAAPIKLDSLYNFFWWINFTTKWQSVYVRILPYSQNIAGIKLEENYTTFYSTTDFQLWAMNNVDHLFDANNRINKLIPKKYILDVNGDVEYLKKPKVGSLTNVVKQKKVVYTLNSDMTHKFEYPTEDLYNYENDFGNIK